MKSIIKNILVVAAAAFTLTACNNEIEVAGEGFPTDVTLSVSIPCGITKSADNPGDGALVNRCILEIYENGVLYGERLYADVNNLTASFAARLVTGSSYEFVFWADYAEGSASEGFTDVYYNTADLSNVSIIADAFVNNEDRRDAFYSTSSATVDGSGMSFTLKRPFGQLNLYTVDLADVPESVDLSTVVAKVSFTEAPAGFNVIEGTLTEDSRISLAPAEFTVPVNFPAAGETPAAEAQISFDYLFASSVEGATLVGFTLELESNGVAVCPDYTADNIPVRQNYRTNVSSNFLTDAVAINVNIIPGFDDPDIARLNAPVPVFGEREGNTVTVSWSAIENAASYTYIINDGAEVNTTGTSVQISDIACDEVYTFKVKAINSSENAIFDSEWSDVVTYTVPVIIDDWYGTYTVTSSYGIAASNGTSGITISRVEEPVTFEFTISEYPNDPSTGYTFAYIMGWSRWATVGAPEWEGASLPGLLQISSDGSQLYFITDVSVGTLTTSAEGDPIDGVWRVLGYVDGYGYTTITGTGYGLIFTKDGDNYTLETPADGQLSDGSTFSYETLEILGSDGTYTYYFNLPYTMPAGEFTLTKNSSTEPSPAPAFSYSTNMMKNLGVRLYGPLPSVSVLR